MAGRALAGGAARRLRGRRAGASRIRSRFRARARRDGLAGPDLAQEVRRHGTRSRPTAGLHGGNEPRRGAPRGGSDPGGVMDDLRLARAATALSAGTPTRRCHLRHGYSEPNSGSDLASLRTRAERDGDGWIINGEKIWTTTYWGDYMWLAARTDPYREAAPRRHQCVPGEDGCAGYHAQADPHHV